MNSIHQQLSGTESFTSLSECRVPCGHDLEKVQLSLRRVLAKLLNKSHTTDVCQISKPTITQLEISSFGLRKNSDLLQTSVFVEDQCTRNGITN
jgi:hypothetical protein